MGVRVAATYYRAAKPRSWPSVTCCCWPTTPSGRPTVAAPPPMAPRRGCGPDIVANNLTAVAKTTGTFPDLSMRWTVPEGIDDLSGACTGHGLTYDDFMSSRFVRRRQIRDVPDDFIVAWPTR